jgi:type IV pilus assembly protein PilB
MAERKIHPWRLGEIMVQKGWITWEQLEEALKLQKEAESQKMFSEVMITPIVSSKPKGTPVLSLGEVLIRHGWISWDQLSQALALQKATGRILGKILLENNFISEKDLQRALAIQYGMTFVDFEKIKIASEIVQLVPRTLAYEHKIFPLVKKGNTLLIAVGDPHNVNCQIAVQKVVPDCEILTALATQGDIQKALERYYG